eukprot:5670297-Amphidinium_carterae.2
MMTQQAIPGKTGLVSYMAAGKHLHHFDLQLPAKSLAQGPAQCSVLQYLRAPRVCVGAPDAPQ